MANGDDQFATTKSALVRIALNIINDLNIDAIHSVFVHSTLSWDYCYEPGNEFCGAENEEKTRTYVCE